MREASAARSVGAADVKVSDARLGYQSAVALWASEREVFWARFSAMVVSSAFVVAGIGFATSGVTSHSVILFALPAGGMLLCWAWGIVMGMGLDYLKYRISSAQELQKYLPCSVVKIVSRSAQFSFGKPSSFEFDGETRRFQKGRLSQEGGVRRISLLAPKIFLLMCWLALPEFVRARLA